MRLEAGDPRFPIWLLGDSEPDNWRQHLDVPLDRRHPIRHNIWTSVLEVVQREVFIEHRRRVDDEQIYVRNAVQDAACKPRRPFASRGDWSAGATACLSEYRRLIELHRPKIVISFGLFSFCFALHALDAVVPIRTSQETETAYLGQQFTLRSAGFDLKKVNVLPLLHRSIAGGHFLRGHEEFCGSKTANYFESVGVAIGRIISNHRNEIACWATSRAGDESR